MHNTAALKNALESRLEPVLGAPVDVADLAAMSMGASKSIWRFTALRNGDEPLDLILRADPIEAQRPEAMALEASVLRAAYDAGVRVPRVIDNGDGRGGIGSPYVIMTAIGGETLPQRNLRDPALQARSSDLTRELGRAISAIHQIPTDIAGLRSVDDVAAHDDFYRTGPLSPAFEIGWRWLREHRPEAHPPSVVHGDFRHGNIIVDQGHLAAVLDWELVHIGDPLEDLGWICTKAWRFGGPGPVGGFGTVSDLLDGYAEISGWRPPERDVLWWTIYGSIRWGVMCRRQANRHLRGDEESLELALIGRRFAENEFDVLLALGHAASGDLAADPPTPRASALFGDPTVADLLTAMIRRAEASGTYTDRLNRSALNVVLREHLHGGALEDDVRSRVRDAGFDDEQDLAAAIRDGAPLTDEVIAATRAGVEARLRVWNPKYLTQPG